MSAKRFTDHVAHLDPRQDYQEITRLLALHIFPWSIERALEFALFRTYAVPSISRLLTRTGELVRRPRKRYDDTELILFEMLEHGFESERGQRALGRMNQMHGRFPISNRDFLYVLSTFIVEPIRWVERWGWRPMTEAEKLAFFLYYCELGRRMGIEDIPVSLTEFEQLNRDYEQTHFRFARSNREVADVTLNLLLGMYSPPVFWPLLRPFVFAVMDDPLLTAFGFPLPSRPLQILTRSLLQLWGSFQSWIPERTSPWPGTSRKRPTYPEGYEIEELGTFPCPGIRTPPPPPP